MLCHAGRGRVGLRDIADASYTGGQRRAAVPLAAYDMLARIYLSEIITLTGWIGGIMIV